MIIHVKERTIYRVYFDMNYHELPMNYHKLIHSTLTPSTFGSDVGKTAIGSHVSEVKVFSRLRREIVQI